MFIKESLFCYYLLIIFSSFHHNVHGLENGLARTPPMGWMHWERFRCITDCTKFPDECISENLFKKAADLLVSEGYSAAGYQYVIIDDCWMERERDKETQKLLPDHERFPSGLNNLSDYIHDKGLLFGLYEDYGTHTCAGYPGVIDHMELDAQTFADWGVDYIKLDGCYADVKDMDKGYPEFGSFMNKTGRPMVYSCSWPVYQEWQGLMPNYTALKQYCNLWRNWGDIQDSYASVTSIVDYFSRTQDRIQPHGGPGHWNDPDMLIIGNFGLTYEQSKSQMSIWAILAAPLIMSNDLSKVPKDLKEVLINRDVIAVNQDVLGVQGRRFRSKDNMEVWVRPITPIVNNNHSYGVAFVSRRDDGHGYEVSVTLKELNFTNSKYLVTDLYNKDFKPIVLTPNDSFKTRVNPNGAEMFKFTAL